MSVDKREWISIPAILRLSHRIDLERADSEPVTLLRLELANTHITSHDRLTTPLNIVDTLHWLSHSNPLLAINRVLKDNMVKIVHIVNRVTTLDNTYLTHLACHAEVYANKVVGTLTLARVVVSLKIVVEHILSLWSTERTVCSASGKNR